MTVDQTSQRSDSAVPAPSFRLEDLPVDVFEVGGNGLTVESLTGGHGMTETGASCTIRTEQCPCSCHQEL
jgi:hypothetical protein